MTTATRTSMWTTTKMRRTTRMTRTKSTRGRWPRRSSNSHLHLPDPHRPYHFVITMHIMAMAVIIVRQCRHQRNKYCNRLHHRRRHHHRHQYHYHHYRRHRHHCHRRRHCPNRNHRYHGCDHSHRHRRNHHHLLRTQPERSGLAGAIQDA